MDISIQFFARVNGSPAPNLTPTWQSLQSITGYSMPVGERPAIFPMTTIGGNQKFGWYGAFFDIGEADEFDDLFGVVDLGAGVTDPKERYIDVMVRKSDSPERQGGVLQKTREAAKFAQAFAGVAAALNSAFEATVTMAGEVDAANIVFEPDFVNSDARRIFAEWSDYLYSEGSMQIVVLTGALAGQTFGVKNLTIDDPSFTSINPSFDNDDVFGLEVGDRVLFSATANSAQLERTIPQKTWGFLGGSFAYDGTSAGDVLLAGTGVANDNILLTKQIWIKEHQINSTVVSSQTQAQGNVKITVNSVDLNLPANLVITNDIKPYQYVLIPSTGANAGKVYDVLSISDFTSSASYIYVASATTAEFPAGVKFSVVPAKYALQALAQMPRKVWQDKPFFGDFSNFAVTDMFQALYDFEQRDAQQYQEEKVFFPTLNSSTQAGSEVLLDTDLYQGSPGNIVEWEGVRPESYRVISVSGKVYKVTSLVDEFRIAGADVSDFAPGDVFALVPAKYALQALAQMPLKVWQAKPFAGNYSDFTPADVVSGLSDQTNNVQGSLGAFGEERLFVNTVSAVTAINSGVSLDTDLYQEYTAPLSGWEGIRRGEYLVRAANGKVFGVGNLDGSVEAIGATLADFPVNSEFYLLPAKYFLAPVRLPNPAPAGYGGSGGSNEQVIALLNQIAGLVGKNQTSSDFVYDGAGTIVSFTIRSYDTAAHAETDDGATGLIGEYSVTNTLSQDGLVEATTTTLNA